MQRYVTLKIPIIDTQGTFGEQWQKVHEELQELTNEIHADEIDHERVMHELQDVIQAMVSFEMAITKRMTRFRFQQHRVIQHRFKTWNENHIEKIKRYKAERGWD